MKNLFLLISCLTASLIVQADTTINELPLGTASATTNVDVFPFVNNTSDVTEKMTVWDLINLPPFTTTYAKLASPIFTGGITTPAIKVTSSPTNGYCLVSDASGNGTWQSCSSEISISVGTIDSQTPATNGLYASGATIYAQSASSTKPGLVNNTTQTLSGAKTLSGNTTFSYAGTNGMGAVKVTGTPYTLPSPNPSPLPTEVPQLEVSDNTSESTTYSTAGTYLGVNSKSGFTGNLLDLQANGASAFTVNSSGDVSNGIWQGTAVSPTYGGTGINTNSSTGYPSISSGTWSVASSSSTFSTLFETIATSLGDFVYGGASGAPTRLARNTVSTKYFMAETGPSPTPSWGPLVSGDIPNNAASTTGNAATATLATTATTATNATNVATTQNDSTNSTYYLGFVSSDSSGNQGVNTSAGLTWNPGTATLTASNITGTASGATDANAVLTAGSTSTNASFFIPFVSSNTSAYYSPATTAYLKFNPSTDTMTIGNVEATAGSIVLNAAGSSYSTTVTPAPSPSPNITFQLPASNGAAGQVLTDSGSGVTAWSATPTLGVAGTTAGSLTLASTGSSTYTSAIKPAPSPSPGVLFELPPNNGTSGYILQTDGTGVTSWVNGLTNPMTTAGDTIYGGSSGTPTRLAIGSTGNVYQVSSGDPAWAALNLAGGSGYVTGTLPVGNGGTGVTSLTGFTSTLATTGNICGGESSCSNPLEANGNIGTSAGQSLFFNGYYSGGIKYLGTGYFNAVSQDTSGNINFFTAGSGSAGGSVTTATPLRITNSNGVLAGGTTVPIYGASLTAEGSANGLWAYTSSSSSTAIFAEIASTSSPLVQFAYGTSGIAGSYASVGSITYNGTVTVYGTTSDERLKENVSPLQDAGSTIDALKAVTYDWKYRDGHPKGVGFIAQDLAKTVPDAVHKGDSAAPDKDGHVKDAWSVDSSKIIPYMVSDEQSLRKRVAILEKKVSELEKSAAAHSCFFNLLMCSGAK